ncbi:LacI family DNA-binding transcriptional regulator [Rathayibacter sp. Leaf299]|uniref:LacI family DNA-binding transcriptional regulator n=1 Tax=Rathayibacter sp. Leaf299 TaxID=1736328 RepID=UPI0009E76F40|nr:LacI family DNA-binding transcriptional regulator [Rathayibacter sp. Leaf299]
MEPESAARAPTLRDIARVAGVSVPTVSKVLNGRDDVSADTRERVQEATAQVGYRRVPSAAVDALIADQLVDLVLPAVGDSWASALIGGVERIAAQNALDLVIIMVRNGETQGRSWVERLVEHRSRGALIAVAQPTPTERRHLERAHIPFVLIDPAGAPDRSAPSVGASNWAGGYDAADFLIDHGHTSFAVIAGDPHSLNCRERTGGFLSRVRERLPEVRPTVLYGGWLTETTARVAVELLRSPTRPTAVFACNDNMALGVYAAAHTLDLRIPDQLSVIGFDDLVEARLASPPLTTVRQPIAEIGAAALRSLLDMRGGHPVSRRLELATELVVRESVAAAPRR